MQYSVKLHTFEGPLDLLLHLIHKNDLDLHDIPVKEITEQYMVYIHTMKVLQLDVASEYLVMAATLLHMKSIMLLPAQEEEILEEDFNFEDEEDPRNELMNRLIEYKKYKEAAGELKERERARSDLFSKPMTDLTSLLKESDDADDYKQMNVSIYDMLQAFQKIQKRKKEKKPIYSKLSREEVPIGEKMVQIMNDLQLNQGRRKFSDLFRDQERYHMVIGFLAILELMKADMIICSQGENFEDITVYLKEAFTFEKSSN